MSVAGEESGEQIKIRGDRIGNISSLLFILSETNLETIEQYIDSMNPAFVIIDSVQTLFKPSITSAPGSVSQVRECSNELMRIAKTKNIPLLYSCTCY
jgi:DNA repair protein RadA/Sms